MLQIQLLGVHGPYPAPGEGTTGMIVRLPEANVLIDVGSGSVAELTKWIKLEELDAVILTHHHWDHISDLGILRYAMQVEMNTGKRKNPLPIYANQEPSSHFEQVAYAPYVESYPIHESSKLTFGGATFTFANTVHAIPCLAVRVEYKGFVFVFSADSGVCDSLRTIATNADVFLCEASWLTNDRGPTAIGHLTAAEAGTLAKEAGVKRLILTHLYPGYQTEQLQDEAQQTFGNAVEIAKRGMIISNQ